MNADELQELFLKEQEKDTIMNDLRVFTKLTSQIQRKIHKKLDKLQTRKETLELLIKQTNVKIRRCEQELNLSEANYEKVANVYKEQLKKL
jgi:hypothetical protein